jgi:hypothetical protein
VTPNVALNRPASFGVSDYDSTMLAGKCVDGVVTAPADDTNKCASSGSNDYLQIDLGQTHQLQWFKLHNRRCPNQILYECLDRINGFTLWSSASPVSVAQHDALKAGQTPAGLTLLHNDVVGGHQNDAAPYIIQGAFAASAVGRYVILHVRTTPFINLREVEIGGLPTTGGATCTARCGLRCQMHLWLAGSGGMLTWTMSGCGCVRLWLCVWLCVCPMCVQRLPTLR